jgi:hypothetical protein
MNSFFKFLKNSARMTLFLLRMAFYEDFKDYIKKFGANNMCSSKKLALFANGPSLADTLIKWKENENLKDVDFLVVNYFCNDKTFIELKPKYYVLSDPSFFDEKSLIKKKADKIYKTLNEKVTWRMFLYIQYYARNNNWSDKITNKNIEIIPYHTLQYSGYQSLRNWFFKRGLGSGNYGTVIQNGEFIGLNLGYKELYLYGVDHTFFTNLSVDENNQLCSVATHFYDDKPIQKPLVNYYISGKETTWTMASYLKEMMELFAGHEILQNYANYCSATIYNCTKNSLIDAYERW